MTPLSNKFQESNLLMSAENMQFMYQSKIQGVEQRYNANEFYPFQFAQIENATSPDFNVDTLYTKEDSLFSQFEKTSLISKTLIIGLGMLALFLIGLFAY